jgi:hypothetical protein
MGHGLTATVLGGDFSRLEIFANGSGIAYHSGDLFLGNIGSALVAAAGPMGPTIAGVSFIIMSQNFNATRLALVALAGIMTISALLWVRPFFGFAFVGLFAIIIFLIALKGSPGFQKITLQFLGVQAFVSMYLSVDYLLSEGGMIGKQAFLSDTAVISKYLFLPYWFWGGLIILFSIYLIVRSFKYIYYNK